MLDVLDGKGRWIGQMYIYRSVNQLLRVTYKTMIVCARWVGELKPAFLYLASS